jgi:Uma2 family endonuclease
MLPAPGLLTAKDLATDPLPDARTELVRGRLLVREPVGYRHGDIVVRIVVAISAHLAIEQANSGSASPRGRLVAGDVGFALQKNPDTVRAPDVAFIRLERCPPTDLQGYPEFAPDLAIEVRSPSERAGGVLARVADLLNAGTQMVWIVDAVRREARIYRADGSETILSANESLLGEDLLPGLVIPLVDLFN